MEPIFIYFLKANALLITFFLTYYFLLRKETFFNKNRWFLILGLVASVLLPLITFTKKIWIEPSPAVHETYLDETIPYVIVNQIEKTPFDWNTFIIYVYGIIAFVFLAKMMIELFSFFRIIKFGNHTESNQTMLIDTDQTSNPFSFFKYIVFNRKMFNEEELQHIISHENIHVKEKHSLDVLLGKIFCALFWINPIMWFYKKEMLQNLEYIADSKASSIAQNRINYQKTLLKVVTNQHQLSITNQFYQSLIKKRIVMLNKNQSNQRKSWKYALILPVLSAFMLLFQVETVAQVKEVKTKKETTNKIQIDTVVWVKDFKEEFNSKIDSNAVYVVEVIQFIIDKKTTDKEIKMESARLNKENAIKLEISKVKRNNQNEIIAFDAKFEDSNKTKGQISIYGDEAIEPIRFFKELDKKGKIGFDKNNITTSFSKTGSIKEVGISWDEANKLSEKTNSKGSKLYIINGKEYLQSEIPKGTTISVDGSISELSKEEGIQKYGQKAKDGVLVFKGKSTFVTDEEQVKKVKLEIERAKIEIEKAKIEIEKARIEIENSKPVIEKSTRKIISGGTWNDVEKELQVNSKKELEVKAQQNSKLSREELEERRKKREQFIEERSKLIEEKKKQLEIRRKEIEENIKE